LTVAGYSPNKNDVRHEAEESLLVEDVAKERLMKTQQAGKF
jgi:hypothetical protein